MEIESARSTCLGKMIINSLDNDDYERWSWEGWNKIGASFATSPPDGIGMIRTLNGGVSLQHIWGNPIPTLHHLLVDTLEKKGRRLDPFGANLASECLPGGGFRRIHNFIQSLVQSMMKVAGIHSKKEAVNFLLGKVGAPFIKTTMSIIYYHKLVVVIILLQLYPTYMYLDTQRVNKLLMTVELQMEKLSARSRYNYSELNLYCVLKLF